METLDEMKLISLAKTTNDYKLLFNLSNSIFISVRRSIAKNTHTPSNILDSLCFDPSENVSFIAKMRRNILDKSVTYSHPCVTCTVDESKFSTTCATCSLLKEYNSNKSIF